MPRVICFEKEIKMTIILIKPNPDRLLLPVCLLGMWVIERENPPVRKDEMFDLTRCQMDDSDKEKDKLKRPLGRINPRLTRCHWPFCHVRMSKGISYEHGVMKGYQTFEKR